MKIQCPVCQTEYDLEPGKCRCECGVKFFVLSDGMVSLSDPADLAAKRNLAANADPERTMAPLTPHGKIDSPESAYDPERTVPNIRIRHERGDLQVGEVVLGRYELLEKIGSGAMGVVFKCRDQVAGVYYALKMVPPELVRDSNAMEDVRRNFQLVHGLKHPNIASMDFLDRDEYGSYFLVMEYVDGENLSHWINRKWQNGRPDSSEVIHIVKQIASALDYAHSQQILHRDIKPANVIVDKQGNVKVLDFGLASKIRSTMTSLSVNPYNTSGTPHYLSPEQFKGKYPGPASDQYALGVLTYQMFVGHLPFEADDFNILCRAVLQEEPERPDGLPDPVWDALKKVLSKIAKERFESCTAFIARLESLPKKSGNRCVAAPKKQKNMLARGAVIPREIGKEPPECFTSCGAGFASSLEKKNVSGNPKRSNGTLIKLVGIILGIIVLCSFIFMLEMCGKTHLFSLFSPDGKVLISVPKFVVSYSIPSSVTTIGIRAFSCCRSLTSVKISSSVTSIEKEAFSWCESLTSVTIPSSVTSIGKEAFSYCKSLTSVTIPSSVTSIGDGTFSYCRSLTSVTIPSSVTSIGDSMFDDCRSLTSVTIPSSVTSIGDGAFANCESLYSVTIPSSVTRIGKMAFFGCHSLTSVTIPSSVISIGDGAFWGTGRKAQVKRDYSRLFPESGSGGLFSEQ